MTIQNTPEELRVWVSLYEALIGGPSATSENMKHCAAAWDADRAALERARALADEWIAGDGETYGDKLMAQMGRRLAAALSSAPGGAA